MQTDMIREKKLKVTNEITNVMEYYNSSFLKAVPHLTAEYKRLAKKHGLDLKHPKPITMGCGLVETVMGILLLQQIP